VLIVGVGLLSIGLIWVWLVLKIVDGPDLTNWMLLVPLLIAGVGNGLFIAPNAQFIVATVDRTEAGAASGVVGVMQRVGSAVGIAVVGSVFFGSLNVTGPGKDELASAFTDAAASGLLLSAIFGVVAFALVFALPKRVGGHGHS